MAGDKSNTGGADHDGIDLGEEYEVAYWTGKWGISEANLRTVHSNGPMASDIARALGHVPGTCAGMSSMCNDNAHQTSIDG